MKTSFTVHESSKRTMQDISSIFKAVGIMFHVVIDTTENTYEIDSANPEDNWLYPAFRGFEKLRQHLITKQKPIKIFATIGTGQGVDAIGAYHILHPQSVVVTDILDAVVPIAKENVIQNTPKILRVEAYHGNLCEPLREHNVAPDIIYANLPNIPFEGSGSIYSRQLTATFFSQEWIKACPPIFEHYLLCLQRSFLHDAYATLRSCGSVVLNLGGRVPLSLVKNMFREAGFTYEELFNMLKVQSQPEWVLGGYARAEQKHRVTFDFYRFDAVYKKIGKQLTREDYSAAQLKQMLKPFRVSASEGLKRFVYAQERIGHIVQIIRGVKQK